MDSRMVPDFVMRNASTLDALCRRFRVRRLALFGSAATGEFGETSDLDFAVSFNSMSPYEHADAYFGLLEALEELFARPVDLVEEEAIRNIHYRRSIEQSRRLVYEAA